VILLDTSVLSAVLRRRRPGQREKTLADRVQGLLNSGARVGVPGVVLQELLSGIRNRKQLESVKDVMLRGYPVIAATVGDHLLAADVANRCQASGVSVSTVDALITALALNGRAQLFTVDQDFARIADHVPLRLFES
jgi:predicted nucleic acid-binding protein